MLYTFKLYIYPRGNKFREILVSPNGRQEELEIFGLTNALFKVMPRNTAKQVFEHEVHKVLRSFNDEMRVREGIFTDIKVENDSEIERFAKQLVQTWHNSMNYHFETPIKFKANPWKEEISPGLAIRIEYWSIALAFSLWLSPTGRGRPGSAGRKKPSEKYAYQWTHSFNPLTLKNAIPLLIKLYSSDKKTREDPDLRNYVFLHEARQHRTSQYTTDFVSYNLQTIIKRSNELIKHTQEKRISAKVFTSNDGLLPLIWAEIMFAIENDIYAKSCLNCGKWFPIPKTNKSHNFNQKFCTGSKGVCGREADKKKRRKAGLTNGG